MRHEFATIVAAQADTGCVFLTGDLGFAALEPVRDAFGDRFLNVGVAEQNMVALAAGIASTGVRVYAYSIASFASLRAVEQLRLDVVAGHLDVCLVGNGGGYGYGHMGPTHHALCDLGVLSAVGVTCLVPGFAADLPPLLNSWSGPTYLRLGRDEADGHAPVGEVDDVTLLLAGKGAHFVMLGPLAGLALKRFSSDEPTGRPRVWMCSRLPIRELPAALLDGDPIVVFEEHGRIGGLGQHLGLLLAQAGHGVQLTHKHALGYPSRLYGSQAFHRAECGLDVGSMATQWRNLS